MFVEQPWLQWLFIFTNTEFIVYINLDYNMKGTLGFFLASVSTAFDTVYCFILLLLLMKWPPPSPTLMASLTIPRQCCTSGPLMATCTSFSNLTWLVIPLTLLQLFSITETHDSDYRCQTTTVWCWPAADMEKDNCLTQTRFEPKLFFPKSV